MHQKLQTYLLRYGPTTVGLLVAPLTLGAWVLMDSLPSQLFGVSLVIASLMLVSRKLKAIQDANARAARINAARTRIRQDITWPSKTQSVEDSDLLSVESSLVALPESRGVVTQHGVANRDFPESVLGPEQSATVVQDIRAYMVNSKEFSRVSRRVTTEHGWVIQEVEEHAAVVATPLPIASSGLASKFLTAPLQVHMLDEPASSGQIEQQADAPAPSRSAFNAASLQPVESLPTFFIAHSIVRQRQATPETVLTGPEQTVLNLLRQVEGTGEIISVTYASGSRPGQPRDLSVVKLTEDNSAIKVREDGHPDEKTYIVRRIMHVKTQDRQGATNSMTVARYMDRVSYERERQNLISICNFGSGAQLKNNRFEVAKEHGHIWLRNKQSGKLTFIQANDIESARRAAFAIELMLAHSQGYWWEIQKVMVNGGVYWPKWMHLQAAAYQDGQRIAKQYEKECEGKKWMEQSFRYRCDGYAESPLWPHHNWRYLDWLRIFEASKLNMKESLRYMATVGLDREEYKEYILGSNGEQKPIRLPDVHISEQTLEKLVKRGLARPAAPPTIEGILSSYTLAQLRPLAKQWGVKTSKLKKAELLERCLQAMPHAEAQQLAGCMTESHLFVLQPPNGLTWEQFQDFKSCYRQMFAMLVAWIDDGDPEFDPAVDKILV